MDRRERYNDGEEALRIALGGWQATVWTCLPGIVQSFDAAKMTCAVQPAIQGIQTDQQGNATAINMPLLLDCPVIFPSGGGCTLTFPIAVGDECVVHFSSRCIDAWWQLGGVGPQAEFRMHDLSDGFVQVGPRSQPRVLSSISTSSVQLRSDDGSAHIDINPSSHLITLQTSGNLQATPAGNLTATVGGNLQATVTGTTTVSSTGAISMTAPSISLNGFVIDSAGNATGPSGTTLTAPNIAGTSVKAAGKELAGHAHTNGNGGANTGANI